MKRLTITALFLLAAPAAAQDRVTYHDRAAKDKGAIVSFDMKGAHPHDVATIIDRAGVAIRASRASVGLRRNGRGPLWTCSKTQSRQAALDRT